MPENYVYNLEKRLQKSFNHVSRDVRFLYRQQLDQVNRIQKCEKKLFWNRLITGILLVDFIRRRANIGKIECNLFKNDDEKVEETE